MGRKQSIALRDAAGAHHVASRLSREGFRAAVEHAARGGAEVLVGLPGGSAYVAVAVRTTECPEGFGDGVVACEWRVGRGLALAGGPGPPVALVDLGGGRAAAAGVGGAVRKGTWAPRPRGRGPPVPLPHLGRGELAPREEDWDAVGEQLLAGRSPRAGWIIREELEEDYGEGFVDALDEEASRLLRAENSTLRRMADERFPAEDLADAQALLSTLFLRYMGEKRERREKEYRRWKREGKA